MAENNPGLGSKPKVNKKGHPVRLRDDFKPFAGKTHLSTSSRRIVLNVFHQTQKIYRNDNLHQRMVKTALLTGLKEATIRGIRKGYHHNQPKNTEKTWKSEIAATMTEKIGGVVIDAIRAKAHEFYRRHEVPTLVRLLNAVNEDESLPCFTKASFTEFLNRIGFGNFRRNHGEGYFERDDLVAWRHSYLRQIRRFRDSGRVIYYLHVSWLNEGESEWCEKTWKGVDKSLRLTFIHVVSTQGSFLSCKGTTNNEEITSDFIADRMVEMYPQMHPCSVIVINSLPYLSATTEKYPTSEHQKPQIQEWLRSKNIQFPTDALKLELLQLVNKELNRFLPQYVIDERAKQWGFEILRLPPHHCQLNPTEMVWLQVICDLKQIYGIRKLSQVEMIVAESISQITPTQWSKYFGKVVERENILWEMNNLLDEPFTCEKQKPTGSDSCSSDSSEEEEEEENVCFDTSNVVVKTEVDES